MENASYIAFSRQDALRRQLDVTANNIANMNTPAFKAGRMLFVEYLNGPEKAGVPGKDAVAMVSDQAVVADRRPGPVEHTGNSLDLAIDGDGYLVVQSYGGPRYTRNGKLHIDNNGQLVDTNGLPLLDRDDRPLSIPPGTGPIEIDREGNVVGNAGVIGSLRLVRFDTPLGLTPLGGGLYVANEVPKPADGATIVQGALEGSNVQPIIEMSQMIEINRSYQSTQNFIQAEHERLRTAIRQLGRIQA